MEVAATDDTWCVRRADEYAPQNPRSSDPDVTDFATVMNYETRKRAQPVPVDGLTPG